MRLPNDSQRLVIVGRTGSGKTRAGMWHLSKRNFNLMPWIIFDYKRDELIAQSPAKEIRVTDKIPKHPGLYVVRPNPDDEDSYNVENLLMRAWAKSHVGMYFDEGYMIPDEKALGMIMTQGRSLRLPTIMLSQRPVWLSRFAFSEADMYQLFHLNDKRDRKTIGAFMPPSAENDLPPFHSHYYDVGKNEINILRPVPDDATILNGFDVPKRKSFFFT